MASWHPTTPLEDEIVSLQPEHNFIFGELTEQERSREAYQPRPQHHLDYLHQRVEKKQTASNELEIPGGCSLNVIRAVHEIAGTKQWGIDASIDDWNTRENVEKETIAMIRHFGMGPSIDSPLNGKLTKPTLPIDNRSPYIMQNGQKLFPVLLDNAPFKIVSTRMRNAELAKAIEGKSNDSSSLQIEDLKPMLSEEDDIDTIEEINKRELKEFQEQYPTLGQRKSKTKAKNKNNTQPKNEIVNWRATQERDNSLIRNSLNSSDVYNTPSVEPHNWRIRNSQSSANVYSTPAGEPNNWRNRNSESSSNLNFSNISNISSGSNSSYCSLNTSCSDDYASAREFPDISNSNQWQPHTPTYASVIENSKSPKELSSKVNNFSKKLDARLYTPKDVYERKNLNKLM